ncbi:hypothetical protein J2X76_001220 [Neorhizobium sp. 2083]|uniref:hypothetical protein n=1 Tax=Neorhizobium sp. 2083 TaxID=2817762 RepID=UPI0028574F5F|nr:hypothetical protein [Neorhizobium sp. 2083]MDR6816066.1 hypothetical protein [Neorhizobium sp. 2083]
MDEISLNIARRHCRSPLSGGEMRCFKKSAMQEIPRLSRKGNVARATKEKVQRQMLGRGKREWREPDPSPREPVEPALLLPASSPFRLLGTGEIAALFL